MKPDDRLKAIENDYAPSLSDFKWLIERVKKLTEALEYIADGEITRVENEPWLESSNQAIMIARNVLHIHIADK